MNRIKAKLNSKRGVSIMLALLLFMVCVFAGSAAITAASSNIGRYTYLREFQQQYYSISSAAQLLNQQFKDGGKIKASFNANSSPKETYECPGLDLSTSVYGLVWDDLTYMLYDAFYYSSTVSTSASWKKKEFGTERKTSFEMTVEKSGVEDEAFDKVKVDCVLKPVKSSPAGTGQAEIRMICGENALEFDVTFFFDVEVESSLKKGTVSITSVSVGKITYPGEWRE